MGLPSTSIQILVDDSTIFLHPSPSPDVPANDPLLRGVVILQLPRPKRVKSVSVRLVRYTNICFPDFAYEFGQSTDAEVSIEASIDSSKEERMFEKGKHSFAFTLIVPSSTAPFERSQYGRVFYKLVATAKGDGLMGSDVVGERDVHIVANPAAEGETQDLDIRVEGFHSEIGPWGTIITSPHLTVGGLLSFDLLLASPPADLRIVSVSAYLHTHYEISSIEKVRRATQNVKHRRQLFHVDSRKEPAYQTEFEEEDRSIDLPPTPTSTEATAPGMSSLMQSLSLSSGSTSRTPIIPEVPSPTPSPSLTPTQSRASSSSTNNRRRNTTPSPSSRAGFTPRRTSTLSISRLSISSKSKQVLPPEPEPLRPLCIIPAGRSYQLSHLARLPNDDIIRPSTLEGTKTPLRVSHEVCVEVRFEQPELSSSSNPETPNTPSSTGAGGSRIRVLKVDRPLTISSCCCMLESLLVPTYTEATSENPPTYADPRPAQAGWSDVCVCGRSMDLLVEEQRLVAALRGNRSSTEGRVKHEYVRVGVEGDSDGTSAAGQEPMRGAGSSASTSTSTSAPRAGI